MADEYAITRLTTPMVLVLSVLLSQDRSYGLGIADATGLRIGTIYPILARLEAAGWLTILEPGDNTDEKKRSGAPRKLYELTPDGRRLALAATEARPKVLDIRPRGHTVTMPSHITLDSPS